MKTKLSEKNRWFIAGIVLLTIFSLTNSCNNNKDGETPGNNEVVIQSFAFNPSSITVPVNTTVTWVNKDATPHTVTSNSGLFDSGLLNNGATYSYKFTATGTYQYYCTLHPNMTATVTVQ